MPSNLPRRLARSIAAATVASLAVGAVAHDNDRERHHLPRLAPAKPAALVGACEDLAARFAGLPHTAIATSTTVAAGTLAVAGQPVPEHCRVTGKTHEHVSPV
ncbi:MAG TPA: tannase/feruloyl esterase family alpha/beta hydrolase, partial [Burkholderiaceae bacterium]